MSHEALNLNTATSNSWIAVIPYNQIDPDGNENVVFNLTQFNFTGLIMAGAEVAKFGEMFPLPTGVVETDKIVTFRYKPDSEWTQYEFLFRWFDRGQNNQHNEYNDYNEFITGQYSDVTVYLLNEFKKPKLKWTFQNCWLKEFGELDMVYDTAGGTGMDHGFSLQYMDYTFDRVENLDD